MSTSLPSLTGACMSLRATNPAWACRSQYCAPHTAPCSMCRKRERGEPIMDVRIGLEYVGAQIVLSRYGGCMQESGLKRE